MLLIALAGANRELVVGLLLLAGFAHRVISPMLYACAQTRPAPKPPVGGWVSRTASRIFRDLRRDHHRMDRAGHGLLFCRLRHRGGIGAVGVLSYAALMGKVTP